MKNYNLLAPGPVPVEPNTLKAFGQKPIHHRTPDFELCLKSCREKLMKVFNTKRPLYCLTSTGSGAMEAAVVNFLSPGDKVLCIVSGKFGERWADMLDVYGMNTIRHELEWGKSIELDELTELLENYPNLKAVYSQMCETSTGALHPVVEMAKIIKKMQPDCLFCVDAITGLLAAPLDIESSQIDVLVSGSQKAFMLPTGMSFVYTSDFAEQRMNEASCPRYYLDLSKERDAIAKGQTFFSSPVNMYFALEAALDYILEVGIDTHYNSIAKRANAVRSSLKRLGFTLCADTPAPALTAFFLPEEWDGNAFRKELESKYALTLMGGQDEWKGKIIRMGHIGYITNENLSSAMHSLFCMFKEYGLDIDLDKENSYFNDQLGA